MVSVDISFVIPAYNESKNILNTIGGINVQQRLWERHGFEVIVIDNGSQDDTVAIARDSGARVVILEEATIAGLRNHGAGIASGDVLIFLDADVILTEEWAENFVPILNEIIKNRRQITGSHTIPPPSENWFYKYWFAAFAAEPDANHIGSAHMIIARTFFEELGGFDESLVTAEDYDICQRALERGGAVNNRPVLKALHPDYPTTITDFVKREIWHGKGDCDSLSSMLQSKSLVAGVVFYGLVLFSLALLLSGNPILAVIFLLLGAGLLLLSSWKKFSHSGVKAVFVNALIFMPYFFGRVVALAKYGIKSSRLR